MTKMRRKQERAPLRNSNDLRKVDLYFGILMIAFPLPPDVNNFFLLSDVYQVNLL